MRISLEIMKKNATDSTVIMTPFYECTHFITRISERIIQYLKIYKVSHLLTYTVYYTSIVNANVCVQKGILYSYYYSFFVFCI